MQGLAKILVIEDDAQARINLSNILEFVGEQCEAISSRQLEEPNWSGLWGGCIVGSLIGDSLPASLSEKLASANHIPLLIAGTHSYPVDELTNYVGDLEYPLNYPQLSEALRHCKDFLGRKGVNVSASTRKIPCFEAWLARAWALRKCVT